MSSISPAALRMGKGISYSYAPRVCASSPLISQYIKTDKVCPDYAQGTCALGSNCWLCHPDVSAAQSITNSPEKIRVEFPATSQSGGACNPSSISVSQVEKAPAPPPKGGANQGKGNSV